MSKSKSKSKKSKVVEPHLRLTIDVSYNRDGFDLDDAKRLLANLADRAADEGYFTGETPLTTSEWGSKVEVIDSNFLRHPGTYCESCDCKLTYKDIDGGRCSCGARVIPLSAETCERIKRSRPGYGKD